jgi:hypothetical protein
MKIKNLKKYLVASCLIAGGLFSIYAEAGIKDCRRLIARLASSQGVAPESLSRLRQLELKTAQGSLLDFREELPVSALRKHNQDILEALKDPVVSALKGSITAISREDANYLVKLITEHPTNGKRHEKKYDPEECYGFCFGRATLIHSEALRRKVDPEAIKKIWAVGPLEKDRWHFHVATMIKAKGRGSWWVCDPVYQKAISAETWIGRMSRSSDDGKMMVFVTDPRRFSVYDPRVYTNIDLLGDGKSDFYNGYFRDYLEHTAKQPLPSPFNP